MNIQLDQETERLLADRVEAGKYSSVSDALREAVRLLIVQEEQDEYTAWLRMEVQKGLDDVAAGRVTVYDREKLAEEANRTLGASW